MSTTCKGTKRGGGPCTRPANWGIPPDSPDRGDYCRDHTETKSQKDDRRKEEVLEILRARDCTLAGACDEVGISVSTLFFMRRSDPGFDADVRDLYEANSNARVARVESAFFNRLTSAVDVPVSTSAFVFYLTNRAPDRWRHTSHLNVGGPDGGPLEIAVRDAKQRLEDRVNRVASRLHPVGVPVGLNGDGGS